MTSDMECVNNISITKSDCLPQCQGLFITGFQKDQLDENKIAYLKMLKEDYDIAKRTQSAELPIYLEGM